MTSASAAANRRQRGSIRPHRSGYQVRVTAGTDPATGAARQPGCPGVADKELSALLATDRVIHVAHGTTFDALRDVSPLLAARSGLTTGDNLSMRDVAAKVAAAAAAESDG